MSFHLHVMVLEREEKTQLEESEEKEIPRWGGHEGSRKQVRGISERCTVS